MNKGTLFVVSAPSGAGKTSLVKALLQKSVRLELAVSHTTRRQRASETEGKEYFFVSADQFQLMREQNEFLEHAEVFGNHYGSSKQQVKHSLAAGKDVLLEIDWQGAGLIRQNWINSVDIFILPPSLQELEQRLRRRREDAEETIQQRLAQAENDIKQCGKFDYVVLNDNFDRAVDDLLCIINAERLRTKNQSLKSITQNLLNKR